MTTLAGTGAAGTSDGSNAGSEFYWSAEFSYPRGVAVTPDGLRAIVIEDTRVRVVDLAVNPLHPHHGVGAVTSLAGSLSRGSSDGVGTSAQFGQLRGVAVTPDGCLLAHATAHPSEHRLCDLACWDNILLRVKRRCDRQRALPLSSWCGN